MIHFNIGSNLNSNHGNRFDNIAIAVNLLKNLLSQKLKLKKFQIFMKHRPILIKIFLNL